MALLPDTTLEKHAIKHTDALMDRLIVGKTTYDLKPSSLEWNGSFRRYVYRQSMVVWRDIGEIEITLGEDGKRVIAFRDRRRFDGAVAAKAPSEAQLLAIAQNTGLVASDARIREIKGTGLCHFVVRQSEPGLPRSIAMTVNAAKRQVAAFEVLEDGR
jgi:hypothetical protein